ncbi:MAG: large-conductance mechanosensitive channel protein MscL [Candidatus Limisoma sp.]
MKKIIKEFKEFAVKGNVVDMAVGVIIGGAFGKIVTSLVGDVVMPAISALSGDADFTGFKWVIRHAVMDGANVVTPEISINYGSFIQTIVDFLIIAFVIFMAIKGINKLKRKEEEKPAEPAADIKLLTEIRDLLKK